MIFEECIKVIGDKSRREVLLTTIRMKKISVGDIVAITKISQSTVSFHLSLLRKVGLINFEVKGKLRLYFPNSEVVGEFVREFNMIFDRKLVPNNDIIVRGK